MQFVTLQCLRPSNDSFGYEQPLPSAKVYVYAAGTTNLVEIYQKDGVTSLPNPVSADTNGNAKFAAADGVYDLQVTSADSTYAAPLLESVQFFDLANFAGVNGLATLSTTGLTARTGSSGGVSQFATRTIAGTAGRVSVTNGDGVAGNPTIDL